MSKTGAIHGRMKMYTLAGVPLSTYEKAIEVYKSFARRCYNNLTMAASVALDNVVEDMISFGFTRQEIEKYDEEVITSLS
ncbi:MAG: hypothetical protein IJT36_03325 [Alphaproteobacteria bacterium]|nr:hypothetical protein [Alphaproteobacteria bacterium]